LSNIKYFDFTAVENKTFFRKKAWVSTATDSPLANLTTMQSFSPAVAKRSGGDDRSRTCDPLNANQVLSQLSYIPKKLVAGTGFEPATFGL
jgi:hypothetical protein